MLIISDTKQSFTFTEFIHHSLEVTCIFKSNIDLYVGNAFQWELLVNTYVLAENFF